MLVAVAVRSPARLQALAASAIELLLSTDITQRTRTGTAGGTARRHLVTIGHRAVRGW
jgi:hypothetical protein